MESSLPSSTSTEAKDLRYCTTRNYPVKIDRATVSVEPIVDGNLVSFTFTAFTDEVILGGEMVLDLLFEGVQFHTENFDLSDGVACPISSGKFELGFSQVVPVGVNAGTYTVKLKMLDQDKRQLSWVALDFTIPRNLPDSVGGRGGRGRGRGRGGRGGRDGHGGRGRHGGRVGRGTAFSFPSLGGRGPTISFEFV